MVLSPRLLLDSVSGFNGTKEVTQQFGLQKLIIKNLNYNRGITKRDESITKRYPGDAGIQKVFQEGRSLEEEPSLGLGF